MSVNTNTWNKIRYTIYTPIYDLVGKLFMKSRQQSIASLPIKPNDKVLLVGAGTGLDLEFLPTNCSIIATDITPAMIERIKKRSKKLGKNTEAKVMDGQKLDLSDNSVDHVILHLIVAVIPDPIKCLQEVARVLRPGGHIVVFDKFIKPNASVSPLRSIMNVLTNALFSDITRDLNFICSHTPLIVKEDIDADFGGKFRRIKLEKPE